MIQMVKRFKNSAEGNERSSEKCIKKFSLLKTTLFCFFINNISFGIEDFNLNLDKRIF